MASISKTTSDNQTRLSLYANEVSTNVYNNTSEVSWELWLENAASGSNVYNYDGSWAQVEINGTNVFGQSVAYDTRNGNVKLASGQLTVYHDENGSKSIELWARILNLPTRGDIPWFKGDMTLTTIPRASQISDTALSGNRNLGSEQTITLDRKVGSFTHQVWYRVFGSDWIDLGKNHGTTVKFTPPLSLAQHSPNSKHGKMDICVRTYNGGTQIGSDVYSNGWYFGIPDSVVPHIDSVSMFDGNDAVKNAMPSGKFVEILSKIGAYFNGARGAYGSTIKSYYLELEGYPDFTIQSHGGRFEKTFMANGWFTVKAFVTDSRGAVSNTVKTTFEVLPYTPPALSVDVQRSSSSASTLTVMRNAKIAPLTVNGQQKNRMRLSFKTKAANSGYFNSNSGGGVDSYSINSLVNSPANLSGYFSPTQSFEIEATLSDLFTTVTVVQKVGSEAVVLSYAPTGVGVGKVWEHGTLDVGGTSYFKDKMYLNNKEVKAAADIKLSDLYQSGAWDAVCPQGTNFGTFLKSDKVGKGLSVVRDNNAHRNVIVMKEDNWWIYGISPSADNIETVAVFNGTYKGYSTGNPEWQTASLQSGWQHHYDYGSVQFSKSADGTVFMRGSARYGRTDAETTIFTLPNGYRPTKFLYKTTLNNSYGTAVIGIGESGQVVVKANVDSSWLNFDNISFRI